jgi:PAS domain-containing protein
MIIYRLIIGGSGMYAGILVIITTTAIGALWHHYRFQKILERKNKYIVEFYIFGLITHIDMLLCMLVLPIDQMVIVFKNILLPVFILFPIATYLLCILLFNQYTRNDLIISLKESEEKYRQIAENFSDVIWTADKNLNTTYVSPSVENLIGEPAEAYMNRSLEEKFPL